MLDYRVQSLCGCHLYLGRLSHLPPKFENIFVAVITFSPFFCANNYYSSLLVIVCALR